MKTRTLTTRRAVLAVLLVLGTVVTCGGLITAATLLHAPPVALPAIAFLCIACPAIVAYELHPTIPQLLAVFRRRGGRRELARLRRELAELPETPHPLGL